MCQSVWSSSGSRLAVVLLFASTLAMASPHPSLANPLDTFEGGSGDARLLSSPPALARSDYSPGDKLKISFFAQLDLPAAQTNATSIAVKTFYQRLDLTGDYTIAGDGTVDIPRLGRIRFAGRTNDEVHADLVDIYEQEIGETGDVHVAVLERQPIYVVGPVRSPGQYKFVPGMVAIQAIALAGGTSRPNDVIGTVLETERASGKSAEARTRLAGLLARQARLQAEDVGEPMIVSRRLESLVGPGKTRELLDMERRASLKAEMARTQEMQSYQDFAAAAETEISSLDEARKNADEQIEVRLRRLDEVIEPDSRLTDQTVVRSLRNEIAELEARRDVFNRQARQLAQRVKQAENARQKIALQHAAEVSSQLVQIADDIARTEEAIRNGDTLSSSLRLQGTLSAPSSLGIAIVRGTANGPIAFPASPTTELAPGDVVQLEANAGGAGSARLSAEELRR